MKTTERPNTYSIPMPSNTQLGLIGIGTAAGGIMAIYQKRKFWGIVGFMILGSLLGRGTGYLITKDQHKNNDSTSS